MSRFGDAFRVLVGQETKTLNRTVPQSASLYSTNNALTNTSSQTQQLQQMVSSSWLFANIDRIASSVGAVEWKLYRKNQGGAQTEIMRHPLLDLINKPNPFFSGAEFFEASDQHFDLVGEMWWLKVANPDGVRTPPGAPNELWLLRPDRLSVVPNPKGYITGYIYTIGGERIPLAKEDIILVKRPNPYDPYRGIGVVQTLMTDIDADRQSARYNTMFFRNGAAPGGVIMVEESMSDEDFAVFRDRYLAFHQGVQNANRIAFLEKAKWQDAKYTQRDMQFEQLRKLTRDLILGAFGMPASVIGVTESVNRANAEAGDVTFARWIVVPRLRRIRSALNMYLVPLYGGGEQLYLDYVDPTPDNRELDLLEATQGYTSQLLTKNEARELLDKGEVEGGDEFREDFAELLPGQAPGEEAQPGKRPGARDDDDEEQEKHLRRRYAGRRVLKISAQDKQEAFVQRQWRKRLKQEAEALSAYLGQFNALSSSVEKIEITDLLAYSWNWFEKFGDDTIRELAALYLLAIMSEYPAMPRPEAERYAANYARQRGGELLQVTGDANLADLTRERVGSLVARSLEEGWTPEELQKQLEQDFAFSSSRAATIARTETSFATSRGEYQAATLQGYDMKRWITVGDERVDSPCHANEAIGWIGIVEQFPSGHSIPPVHPNERCFVEYGSAEAVEDSVRLLLPQVRAILPQDGHNQPQTPVLAAPSALTYIGVFKCTCGKLLNTEAYAGIPYWCERCKESKIPPQPKKTVTEDRVVVRDEKTQRIERVRVTREE